MRRIFSLLAIASTAAVIGAVGVWVHARVRRSTELRDRLVAGLGGKAVWLAWVVALVATLGSLYLSEIAHLEPCRLCWYQRIAMYPLVVILAIGAARADAAVRRYAAPVAGIGLGVAVYHYLIQHFPDLEAGTCSVGVSCAAPYIWEFGFVSIPYMAAAAFAPILVLLAASVTIQPAPPGVPEPASNREGVPT